MDAVAPWSPPAPPAPGEPCLVCSSPVAAVPSEVAGDLPHPVYCPRCGYGTHAPLPPQH